MGPNLGMAPGTGGFPWPCGYTGHSPWPPDSGKGSGASLTTLWGLGCCVGARGALTPPGPRGLMSPALQPLPIFVSTLRGCVSNSQLAVSQFSAPLCSSRSPDSCDVIASVRRRRWPLHLSAPTKARKTVWAHQTPLQFGARRTPPPCLGSPVHTLL